MQAARLNAPSHCGAAGFRRATADPSPGPLDGALRNPERGRRAGAGRGNRTLVFSLEGCCSTIELYPQRPRR